MGMDRVRMGVEGLEEITISLDWSKSKLVPVVADEKASFQSEESRIVGIRPISIPSYSMVFQSFHGSNGMGHLLCIGALEFKKFTEDRIADKGLFQSRVKAAVLQGDLLGQVIVVPGKSV